MIENQKQYAITKEQAEKFRLAIANFNTHQRRKLKISESLIKAEKAGLESMYQTLLDQMEDYEKRTRGN